MVCGFGSRVEVAVRPSVIHAILDEFWICVTVEASTNQIFFSLSGSVDVVLCCFLLLVIISLIFDCSSAFPSPVTLELWVILAVWDITITDLRLVLRPFGSFVSGLIM
jgi:hypothetical protein